MLIYHQVLLRRMTSHYLSLRAKWQDRANTAGAKLEDIVYATITDHLTVTHPGIYRVTQHPSDFDQLYLEAALHRGDRTFAKPEEPKNGDIWYDVATSSFLKQENGRPKRAKLGCEPDIGILHIPSGRKYFIECKQQNDAGNAHERAAKWATPSIIATVQRKLGGVTYHPLGYLFSGPMVTNLKYILEIEATFDFARQHLLLWQPDRPVAALCDWVDTSVIPVISTIDT
jgi:hypothetical protein